jgi:hypothetical protein
MAATCYRPMVALARHLFRWAFAAALLAAVACAGCGAQGTTDHPPSPSVQACIHFGVRAIHDRVTVRTLPPACRGLTRDQVNYAVGTAVRSVAGRVRGKARQRRLAAEYAPLLAHLVKTVPPARSQPAAPVPAAEQVSHDTLSALALACWLLTVWLGSWMMSRWLSRRALRGALRRQPAPADGLPPLVNFGHFGLAVAGLLTWIAYLATGAAVAGWIACAALLPTAGIGMSLVFLGPSGRRSVFVVAAHIALAVATILFTLLAVAGPG